MAKRLHVITGPQGNSEFCFPSTPMLPLASPQETLSSLGKQNSLYPLGPVIKCLMSVKGCYTMEV